MRAEEKIACARALADNPLVSLLLDEMEKAAVDKCVNAAPVAHEERAAMAAEVRAIRKFRLKIKATIDEANAPNTGAPA
ncbi:hypothetical protein ASG25_10675 [Rhizobium sp. Leaf384]|uniref:hypothetical protein n=1 Tax=Rhizobium sp. Leaf384 TaxID=1736358 RepID=UPI0007146994|nr:hypothetical protein [Rhizobium sp. Leaf384]KQS79042.1 hypothetical protein ASG25_10675 [Rhizobium sp. Leaf384]